MRGLPFFLVSIAAFAAMTQDQQIQAGKLYQKQDWPALFSLASHAAALDAKDGFAWYYLGLADDGLNRRPDAIDAFQKALLYVPPTLRPGIQQAIAADYVALRQNDKLLALYRELQKSDPQTARAIHNQYPNAIAKTAPSATLPEVSPQSLAALQSNIRRTWKPDAIAVQIDIKDDGAGLHAIVDFFSPSTKQALSAFDNQTMALGNSNWNTSGIPSDFLPLAAAVARIPGNPPAAEIDHAYLLRESPDSADASDLTWSIALKRGSVDVAAVPAYIMPKSEYETLLFAANRGEPEAEYRLARVYASGVAGNVDLGKSVEWLNKSAAANFAPAQNRLGQYSEFGVGMPRNPGNAIAWYRKSAAAGFAPGEYNLGLMYERGLGVARDFVTARQWIEKAAKQGLGPAISELPVVIAAANGQIRRYEQMKAQQARGTSGSCPLGYFRTQFGCKPSGAVFSEYRYRTGKNM